MQITHNYDNNTYTNINSKNTSFNGFGVSPRALLSKKSPSELSRDCSYIAGILGEQTRNITTLLEHAPSKRVAFMDSLTASFNARNFMLDTKLKESSEPVIKIYNLVTKPEPVHFNIVSRSEMPFESLEKIFEHAQDKKSLEFVQDMQHNVLDGSKESAEHIVKMLQSPNRKAYIAAPMEYRSYMKLHSNDEKAVDKLDDLILTSSYDRKKYDAKLAVKEMMKNKNFSTVLGKDAKLIEENYTEERKQFLDKFCGDYLAFRKGLSEADSADILDMFTTTTPENVKTRLEIIDKFKNVYVQGQSENSEVSTMKALFDRIDSDKHAKGFVDKALGDGIKVESMEEFNRIMDIIPPAQAEIFHKNVSRIVRYTNVEEREKALLDNIQNPNYVNPRIEEQRRHSIRPEKKDNVFVRFAKNIENTINKNRYNRHLKFEEKSGEIPYQTVVIPVKPTEEKIASINIPEISEVITKPVETEAMPKLVSTLKENPQIKKLRIRSEVNNVIERKLGEKTLEKQQGIYSEKATAMRLNLLPEIFDSISATRKSQKAKGLRPTVSNSDAVKLYERIQGKNKKLVRYMLKKTDENGNRIFDIKDIIRTIDEANTEISTIKKSDHNFKSKEAKAYYDSIYDKMVERHGKLKTSKKK